MLAVIGMLLVAAAYIVRDLSGELVAGKGGGKVAVVLVEGVISDSREIVEQLNEYEKNNEIKAVVIRINSPGGGVVPSQEIYDKIMKVKEKKTVVASMGIVAASGGYYIAAATDRIMANPGTLTGSIGVIMQFSHVKELLEKIGLKASVIKSGEFKDTGSPLRGMTDEEVRLLQEVVDDIHDQFIEAVLANRPLSAEQLTSVSQSRIFTGRQALKQGLVDELGGLEDAIAMAAEMAGIEGEPRVVYPKRRMGLLRYLVSETTSGVADALMKNNRGINYLYHNDLPPGN